MEYMIEPPHDGGAPLYIQRCLPCVFGYHECLGVWNPLADKDSRKPCRCPVCERKKVPTAKTGANSNMDTKRTR